MIDMTTIINENLRTLGFNAFISNMFSLCWAKV